jgi:hypothetical protein
MQRVARSIYTFGALVALLVFPAMGWAQSTGFTYQGHLQDAGAPANGDYAMTFRLFDADVGGTQVGPDVDMPAVTVTGGLFSTQLDFGVDAYTDNQPRWLEITINAETLAPLQALTPAPFSLNTRGIHVDSTGRVGIGVAAPLSMLHVGGETGVDGVMFPDGTLQTTAALGNVGSIWSLNGTSAYYNAGKVGIGRNDPPDPLSFANAVGDKISLYGDTGGTFGFGIQSSLLQIHSNNSLADIAFGYGPSATFTERMRVRGNGNVGIGTSAPGAKLHVAGGMKIDGQNTLEFGAGISKEVSAGKIGYQSFGSHDSLDIVGAGTLGTNRKINFWNEGGAYFTGSISTTILQIRGGADLAEPFDVNGEDIQPGMVVSIDTANPGRLLPCTEPFDRKVAGIISGAGGVATGLSMGHEGTIADGKHLVALTGRVYCLVDASTAAIEPGDMLTTSSLRGHAMRASDLDGSRGAVIGKAMTNLAKGERGLVLVLVNLQ